MKPQIPTSGRRAAFTLIELLTVIAIIAILAAMTMGIVSFAQRKASEERTRACIALLEAGIEQYRDKYGEYPVPVTNNGQGIAGAIALYQALCDDGDDQLVGGDNVSIGEVGENYFVNLVAEGFVADDGRDRFVKDGFDRPIYYQVYDKERPEATHQETFDLWSYGTDRSRDNENKWIKNW